MNNAVAVKKRIGIILLVLCIIVLLIRLISESIFHGIPFLSVIFIPPNLVFIPILSAVAFTILSSSKAAFFVQAATVLLTGIYSIFSSYSSFYGVGSYLMGAILFYKYGFMDTRPRIKIGILLGVYLLVTEMAARFQEPGYRLIGIDALIYSIAFTVMLWIIFEREIRVLLTEKVRLEEEIIKAKPFAEIGEHAGGLIHNLKSDLMVILASLELYEAGKIQTLEPLGRSAQNLAERINGISELIKTRSGKGCAVVNGSMIAKGVVELIRSISGLRMQADLVAELPDDIPVYGCGDEIAQVLENVVKNSLEAVQQTGKRGIVRIGGSQNSAFSMITIEDNAGPMEICLDCANRSCLSCERIGIGNTTKVHGTGIGLSYVKRIMKKTGGDIRIDSDSGGVRTTLMFRKTGPTGDRTAPDVAVNDRMW